MNRKQKLGCLALTLFVPGLWFFGSLQAMGQSQEKLPAEEVSVHVVNPVSLTEEFIWMHISVTTAEEPSPSKVIYMELLDRNGNSVVADLAKLEEGKAKSYLRIPPELPSDHYLLRVYTRISPYTSGAKGVFQSLVTIINPTKPPLIVSEEAAADKTPNSPPIEALEVKKQDLAEVSLALPNSKNISVVIRRAFPIEQPGVAMDFADMYPVDATQKTALVPELYGHIVKGRLLDSEVDTTETFYLTVHGSQSHMLLDRPRPNGDLFFDTGDFSYFDYVIVQSAKTEQQANFILSSPFWNAIPTGDFQFPALTLTVKDEVFIKEMILARASHLYYLAPEKIPEMPLPFQYITDHSYLLDDYNRFEDMATTIREYVPLVLVRNQNRKTVFKNINIPNDQIFEEHPLLVIDGMPVFDSDKFADFNPTGIKRMDIVNRYFYINDQRFSGMVNLTSFKNDFGGFDLPQNALFIAYPGIQKPYRYVDGAREGELFDHFPDFRSVLAWQTDVTTDENGKLTVEFRPSRLKGKFTLSVHYQDIHSDEFKTRFYSLELE